MRAYVAFARREPGYFRLMFRPELSAGTREHPGLQAAEHAAGEQLDAAVADCVDAGIITADQADVLGVAAWSLAHGLASLWPGVLPAGLVTRSRRVAEAALRPWTPVFIHGDLQVDHVFVAGYGTDVDLDVIRAWWSLRSLLARWLIEHGFDPSSPGCEFAVLRSRL
jgi:hypothetical protein